VLEKERERERAWQDVEREAVNDVVIVAFNAWRYQDSTQIWAGLASTVTTRLEAALPALKRRLTFAAYAWRNRRAEVVSDLLVPTAVAVVVVVLAFVGAESLQEWIKRQSESNALARVVRGVLPGGALVVASLLLIGRVRRVLQPVSERVLSYMRRPDYRDQMGYQHRVLDDLSFVYGRLRHSRPHSRVVVFIDDLDRCSDDKIMEILQAINLILGESEFFVVLGIETQMIHRAIQRHYAAQGDGQLPKDFAEQYLRKIIQLPFHLPTATSEQQASFVLDLFSVRARQELAQRRSAADPGAAGQEPDALLWNEAAIVPTVHRVLEPVEDTADELEALLEYQWILEDNPRELKRLVNVHRFVKMLFQGGAAAPPKVDQRRLVKWLVFCARWPRLIDDALDHARANPNAPNCLSPLVDRIPPDERDDFRRFAGGPDLVGSAALQAGAPLAQAALVSQLVIREQSPSDAARDEAEAAAAQNPG